MIVARVEHHWFSFIGILLISYGIAIQPTKQGQATQIRLPWLDKPSKRQASHVRPTMPSLMGPGAAQKQQIRKNKNMAPMGLGSDGF